MADPGQQNGQDERTIETDVPARMDRLPWSGWHAKIITALGVSWLLDGLEVTLVGSLSGVLESRQGLGLTDPQVTSAATVYLAGAVTGALFFGWLTDRLGRKKLFLITLATYSLATVGTAFSHGLLSFSICRFCTGLGIGGEYAAINSAVDELIPGKVRGTVDLVVNGTFWVGASIGALAAMYLLGNHGISQEMGWRYAFGIGGTLGMLVLLLRLQVPESPRWLMLRGKEGEADKVVQQIEAKVGKGKPLPPVEGDKLKLAVRDHTPIKEIFQAMLTKENRPRSFLGMILMIGQSFFFNAVFFTYGLVVKKFFHIPDSQLPIHLLPFAVGSFLRADAAGAAVRQDRAQADDYGDVCDRRGAAGGGVHSVCAWDAGRARAGDLLYGDLLCGLVGGERGVSDGERDLSAGDTGVCDCDLLLAGDGGGRGAVAGAVRAADRVGVEVACGRRIRAGGGADDRGGGLRGLPRGGGGGQVARVGFEAAAVAMRPEED